MVAAHLTTADSVTSLNRTPSNAGYMAPYNFPRKYSALTKPRWICFGEPSIQNSLLTAKAPWVSVMEAPDSDFYSSIPLLCYSGGWPCDRYLPEDPKGSRSLLRETSTPRTSRTPIRPCDP